MNNLSSKATLFWKIIFPIPFFIIWIIGAYNLYDLKSDYLLPELIFGAVLLVFMLLTTSQARKAHYDGEYLYISNFKKEEKIPLTRIMTVNELSTIPRMATIILKEPCGFGKKVKYIQRPRIFNVDGNHPDIVKLYAKLQEKAEKELETNKKTSKRIKLFAE